MSNNVTSEQLPDFNHPDELYKTLIKPIRDDFISGIIDQANTSDTFSPWDKDLSWKERQAPIIELKTLVKNWASNWLENLDKRNFPFIYIMNGNSDYLNDLFRRRPNIAFKKGDYSYYSKWHQRLGLHCGVLTEPAPVEDIVVSWPGYNYGDSTELDFARKCNPVRLHLDCAYLGLVEPIKTDVTGFETVAISLSKSFAIPYNRISVVFSKTELPDLEILNKIGYVNLDAVKIAVKLLKSVPHDYWWKTYSGKIAEVCQRHGLTPTKSIMFAYDKYGRRLSLAPYLREQQ